jgi:hypothetical protein
MKLWSNIETNANDPEIAEIDKIETLLVEIPRNVIQIRELITGFEVCHFKYLQHIKYIKKSIKNLHPNIELQRIGAHHIRQADVEWKKDKTGRSFTGQQDVIAIEKWIDTGYGAVGHENMDARFEKKIWNRLGKKEPEKERLAKLLIARLKWDWESYEKLLKGDENDELEYQVCRMDICHYNFPVNMDSIIEAIGKLQPVKGFEGCGSYSGEIKDIIEKEVKQLNMQLDTLNADTDLNIDQLSRKWLIASFAKTLKEQAGLNTPIHVS